ARASPPAHRRDFGPRDALGRDPRRIQARAGALVARLAARDRRSARRLDDAVARGAPRRGAGRRRGGPVRVPGRAAGGMSGEILAGVLEEQEDLLTPYLDIVQETRRKIAAILGSDLEETSIAAFRESLVARPAFREYARLVAVFPLLRARPFTPIL